MDISPWVDKNGLIKPRADWVDSGNGILYTVLCQILLGYPSACPPVLKCWNNDLDVLQRTPQNTYGQESHDDWRAFAIMLYIGNNTRWARTCLWSCVKKFGFMQNDFVEPGAFWKSQMLRFPDVWWIMIAAAFRPLTFLFRGPLTLLIQTQTINIGDQSGTQLQWLQRYAIAIMGNKTSLIDFMTNVNMVEIMTPYYDNGHPIIEGFKNFNVDNLK